MLRSMWHHRVRLDIKVLQVSMVILKQASREAYADIVRMMLHPIRFNFCAKKQLSNNHVTN